MQTLACGGNQVPVVEIARVGGFLNESLNLEEVLYRTRENEFLYEETFTRPLPDEMIHAEEEDPDAVMNALAPKVRVSKITPDEAIVKFFEMFAGDRVLSRLIESRLGLNASKAPRRKGAK